jgi:hypothetical protein
MLAGAFASWVSALSERGFDETFILLLRANSFYDVRFRHGAFEFGKDFVAKRSEGGVVYQYGFQSKAGDVGGSEWSSMYGQLDELAAGRLAPSGFDNTLPRRSVLVLTGRLVGKAALAAEDFKGRVKALGHGDFEVWERDCLAEMAEASGRFPVAPSASLTAIAAHVQAGLSSDRSLEGEMAALVPGAAAKMSDVYRALVDNAVVTALLVNRDRPFQALTAALNGLRIVSAVAHHDPASAKECFESLFTSYIALGRICLAKLLKDPSDQDSWLTWMGGVGFGALATYPYICLRVLEFVGLAAIWSAEQGRVEEAAAFTSLCRQVIVGQPGVLRPISDRQATSLAPAVLALHRDGDVHSISVLLGGVTKWICDRYVDSEAGLAGPYASPEDEVRTLLGAPFESVNLSARRESLVAVAVADLSYYAAPALYADIVNDLRAVGIVPTALHCEDTADSYVVARHGTTKLLLNIGYPDVRSASRLRHHDLNANPRRPEQVGGTAAVLALACLARDRLFSDCYPRFVERYASVSS